MIPKPASLSVSVSKATVAENPGMAFEDTGQQVASAPLSQSGLLALLCRTCKGGAKNGWKP